MPDRERVREGRAAGARVAVPAPRDPALVRNVVLVGHAGAGKTTLVETLLAETATIGRAGRVEDGSTVADADPVEARLGHSVALALAPFEYGGVKVNLLDTPGHPDFVGDLRAGLRAADAALFVVSAVDGVDAQTVALWEECEHVGMPRAVVVTRLDSPRADFEQVVAILQREFGPGVLPLHLPMHADDESVAGLIQLLSQRVADYSTGQRTERDPDPEHVPLIEQARSALIEAVIAESEDETLLDRYLAGEAVPFDVLVDDLETAVARAAFHPVLAVARLTEGEGWVGTTELLEVLTSAFPGPSERALPVVTSPTGRPEGPLSCDPAGPLVAEVLKTTSDPYAGRLSLVRVFSGTLRPDQPVHLSGHGLDTSDGLGIGDGANSPRAADSQQHDVDERVGQLSTPLGAQSRPVAECRAGDLCTIARLARAETGDTLSAPTHPLLMAPWERDEPLLPLAVEATGPPTTTGWPPGSPA